MGSSRGSTGRINTVKTGCVTCKARKVKCDEGFPACRRCTSASRTCGGYGIWGGGGRLGPREENRTQYHLAAHNLEKAPLVFSISPLVVDGVETALYEWFLCRTAIKIPGAFFSDFWTTLLPQASHTEPAVLHAVLALSATHWAGGLQQGTVTARPRDQAPERMERLMLQHYNRAISHLTHAGSAEVTSSRRVVLTACLLFIAIEIFRGNFATAQVHLRSGLQLLSPDFLFASTRVRHRDLTADHWIAEVFSRMLVQLELFGRPFDHPYTMLQASELLPKAPRYGSFKEAWAGLQCLTNATLALAQRAQQLSEESKLAALRLELVGHQQRIRAGLTWWSSTYEASYQSLTAVSPPNMTKAFSVLRAHYFMTAIMADSSVEPDDEMIYDASTNLFNRLVTELENMWLSVNAVDPRPWGASAYPNSNNNTSILDMGWVQPLYFTVTKCRVLQIRRRAIRLLTISYHREGIWDSAIVAHISKKIVEIEEGRAYDDLLSDVEFEEISRAGLEDLEEASVPETRRLRGLEVVLSGSPLDEVGLYCWGQDDSEGSGKVCIGRFDVVSKCWADESLLTDKIHQI